MIDQTTMDVDVAPDRDNSSADDDTNTLFSADLPNSAKDSSNGEESFDGEELVKTGSTEVEETVVTQYAISIWDVTDQVHRCSSCNWELDILSATHDMMDDPWICCGIEHEPNNEDFSNLNSESCENVYQGELPESWKQPMPSIMEGDRVLDEQTNLLKRGITQAMIDDFDLHFDANEGIFWTPAQDGDEDDSDSIIIPELEDGEIWRVHLGPSIELHPNDENGSQFLSQLLDIISDEMATVTAENPPTEGCWVSEKSETLPGWITRWRSQEYITATGIGNFHVRDEENDSDESDDESTGGDSRMSEVTDNEGITLSKPPSRKISLPVEVLSLIIAHVHCSSCRKSLRMVSKLFNKLASPAHTLSRLIKNIAQLRKDRLDSLDWPLIMSQPAGLLLFEEMPSLHHYMNPVALCENERITLDFVTKYPLTFNWPHCWTALSENSAMTEKIIKENLQHPWDWGAFAKNSSLSCDFYLEFRHKPIKWTDITHLSTADFLRLSEHPINWKQVWNSCKEDEYVVDMRLLLLAQKSSIIRLDVSLDGSFKPLNIFKIAKENVPTFFSLRLSDQEQHGYGDDIWQRLSHCRDITLEHVLARPDANWNLDALGKRIPLREKLANLQLAWCLTLTQGETPPPLAFVNANMDLNWPANCQAHWYSPEALLAHSDCAAYSAESWRVMSQKADFATVKKHRFKSWNWATLSHRVDATFLLAHADVSDSESFLRDNKRQWQWDMPTLSGRSWSLEIVLHPALLRKWTASVWSHVKMSTLIDIPKLLAAAQHIHLEHLAKNKTLMWSTVAATKTTLNWPLHSLGRFAEKLDLPAVLPDDFDIVQFSCEVTFAGYKKFEDRKDLEWEAACLFANDEIPLAEAMKWTEFLDEDDFYEGATTRVIEGHLDQDELIANLKYGWDFSVLSEWAGSNLCKCHG